MDLNRIVEAFLPTKLGFHDEESGETLYVRYESFIKHLYQTVDEDFFDELRRQEKFRSGPELTASPNVLDFFIRFYGEPEIPRGAMGEFNQMFSANFVLMSTDYLKRGKRSGSPLGTTAPRTPSGGGCLGTLVAIISTALLLFL